MNNEAIAEAGSLRPRFLDFKIYADSEHHSAGVSANLLPISANVSPLFLENGIIQLMKFLFLTLIQHYLLVILPLVMLLQLVLIT